MNDTRKQTHSFIGILVCEKQGQPPFGDQMFYRRLIRIGREQGLQVFVFSPNGLHWEDETIDGYTYAPEHGGWKAGRFPLPAIVYDRSFFRNRHDYGRYRECLIRLKERPDVRFLGYGLRGKLQVHRILQRDEALRSYLPATRRLTGWASLTAALQRDGTLFLKPDAGSQGKGVLRLGAAADGSYTAVGRSGRNEPFARTFASEPLLRSWLEAFTAGRSYLVQPYLRLNTRSGEPFDIRCLVQKNRRGVWSVTGLAVRRGASGNVTSNLHGGGVAMDLEPFLQNEFGEEKARQIRSTLLNIASRVPVILEQHHGRLAELGIDLGIDASGHVWILEANSKPGRSAFARLSDPQVRLASIRNPIYYARYLLDTTRRVIS
ncbi:YheC/YheD family endospore coat-associated protein [Paenibacillus koleovorans]|uniref:YheC/YheD family endospore coat-associated protein n=1 Tax=Paenibacillus koleovorans TaxID=121608 RepID=UPI0013E34961|nr:YheC/YheD family protein [Paenibacillus koleovorans]